MESKKVLVVSHQKSIRNRYVDSKEIKYFFVESVSAALKQLNQESLLPDLVVVSGCMLQESNLMALLKEMRELLPDTIHIHLLECCHSFDGEELPHGIHFTSNDHTVREALAEELSNC